MSDTSPYHRMLAILYDCMGSTSSHVEGMAKFHNTPCPDDIIDSIQGNAPRHAKEVPLKLLSLFRSSPGGFADGPGHRLRITEISVDPCREDPERLQGTLISELVVEEDMLNVVGTLMGGCTSWIIDEGSTLAYAVAKTILEPEAAFEGHSTASAFLEIYFHAPAHLGDTLRIVNTSKTSGSVDQVCRTEIWNATTKKLVASGNQIKSITQSNNKPRDQRGKFIQANL